MNGKAAGSVDVDTVFGAGVIISTLIFRALYWHSPYFIIPGPLNPSTTDILFAINQNRSGLPLRRLLLTSDSSSVRPWSCWVVVPEETVGLTNIVVRANLDHLAFRSSRAPSGPRQVLYGMNQDGALNPKRSSLLLGNLLRMWGRLPMGFLGLEIGNAGSIEELSGVCPFCCSKGNHNPEQDDCHAEYLRPYYETTYFRVEAGHSLFRRS
jgi:hypothetical protein